MGKAISHATALLVASMSSVSGIADESANMKKEGDAHHHHFYSELLTDKAILYVVCNQSDGDSDFFWSMAGFGVGENKRLPQHKCLERKDYVSQENDGVPLHSERPSSVFVRDESGEIETIFWCDYAGLDRCSNSFMSGLVSWASGLRMFGEGPSNEPIDILGINIRLSDGRYRVDIKYSEEVGEVIVIARGGSLKTSSFENLDFGQLDMAVLGGEGINQDTSIAADFKDDFPVLKLPSSTEIGGVYSFYFSDVEMSVTSLTIISQSDGEVGFRLDGPPLDSIGR